MRLKGKVAIVTGAASGIGKGIARTFANEGAKVAVADLNQEAADAAARELDPSGDRATGIAMDVSSEAQVEASMATAIAMFGQRVFFADGDTRSTGRFLQRVAGNFFDTVSQNLGGG